MSPRGRNAEKKRGGREEDGGFHSHQDEDNRFRTRETRP